MNNLRPQQQAIQIPGIVIARITINLTAITYWDLSSYDENAPVPARSVALGIIGGDQLRFDGKDAVEAYKAYLSLFGQARV